MKDRYFRELGKVHGELQSLFGFFSKHETLHGTWDCRVLLPKFFFIALQNVFLFCVLEV